MRDDESVFNPRDYVKVADPKTALGIGHNYWTNAKKYCRHNVLLSSTESIYTDNIIQFFTARNIANRILIDDKNIIRKKCLCCGNNIFWIEEFDEAGIDHYCKRCSNTEQRNNVKYVLDIIGETYNE